jgi:hypothetical protein
MRTRTTRTIPVKEETVYCVLESQVAGKEEGEEQDQNYQDHSGTGGDGVLCPRVPSSWQGGRRG